MSGSATFGPELGDDPVYECLELLALDRALDRRPLEPRQQFRPVERLARAVALPDVEGALVVALVGGEAAVAAGAAPARRTASPGSLRRESATRVSVSPQKGQYMYP